MRLESAIKIARQENNHAYEMGGLIKESHIDKDGNKVITKIDFNECSIVPDKPE